MGGSVDNFLLKLYSGYRDYARDISWVQWTREDIIYNVMVLCVCITCCIKVNGQQVPHARSLALYGSLSKHSQIISSEAVSFGNTWDK